MVWSSPRYDLHGMVACLQILLNSNFGQIPPSSLLKSCRKGSTDENIYQSFHRSSLFPPETRKFSCVEIYVGHSELCGAPFIFRPKSLLFEITCRGNLCKNAKERVRECSDAPSTRRCPEPPPLVHTLTPCRTYSYSPPHRTYSYFPQTEHSC